MSWMYSVYGYIILWCNSIQDIDPNILTIYHTNRSHSTSHPSHDTDTHTSSEFLVKLSWPFSKPSQICGIKSFNITVSSWQIVLMKILRRCWGPTMSTTWQYRNHDGCHVPGKLILSPRTLGMIPIFLRADLPRILAVYLDVTSRSQHGCQLGKSRGILITVTS